MVIHMEYTFRCGAGRRYGIGLGHSHKKLMPVIFSAALHNASQGKRNKMCHPLWRLTANPETLRMIPHGDGARSNAYLEGNPQYE